MSAAWTWGLVLVALVAGYLAYGGAGLVLAFTVVVFWLLLQFNRSLRVMKLAAGQPLGHTANAVMLASRLRPGQALLDVIKLTHSLGLPRSEAGAQPEVFEWADEAGDRVRVTLAQGRITEVTLQRGADQGDQRDQAAAPGA
jgi:uncharacterized protein (DUF58 family)